MTPLIFFVGVLLLAYWAGLLGALAGIGGGIVIVPALTLIFGVDIHTAIATSIVAVVATSTGAAPVYVRNKITNIRLGMLLETATVAGSLTGALIAVHAGTKALYILFSVMVTYTAVQMLYGSNAGHRSVPHSRLADRLKLHGIYYDKASHQKVPYRVVRTELGLVISAFAGLASGLLGVGGGAIKVPAMHLLMGLPMKVCTATSNFMIGVTAASGAAVYFIRGEVAPLITAPVVIGVVLGATTGAKIMNRIRSKVIKVIFVIILIMTAIQMFIKAWS
jgi:uncharacterized membrane protein YfcA